MKCERYAHLLSLYATGDLEEEEKREIDAHLEVCEACRQELEELSDLKDSLLALDFEDPGEEFWERFEREVMAATEGESAGRLLRLGRAAGRAILPLRGAGFSGALGYAAAALLVAALGGLFVWKAHLEFMNEGYLPYRQEIAYEELLYPDGSFEALLPTMEGEELLRIQDAVAGWRLEIPESALEDIEATELEYSIYSEIERMGHDELSSLSLAIEKWEKSS